MKDQLKWQEVTLAVGEARQGIEQAESGLERRSPHAVQEGLIRAGRGALLGVGPAACLVEAGKSDDS